VRTVHPREEFYGQCIDDRERTLRFRPMRGPDCFWSSSSVTYRGLTGTHVGCDTSQCGACVVHVDGKAVKSCTMLAAQADGSRGRDARGAGSAGEPASGAGRVPRASRSAVRLLHARHDHVGGGHDQPPRRPNLDEKTVRHELEGNICRCTGYHNIVKAISTPHPRWGWPKARRIDPAEQAMAKVADNADDQEAGALFYDRSRTGTGESIANAACGRRPRRETSSAPALRQHPTGGERSWEWKALAPAWRARKTSAS
jgi:carbon-monoxide dehydrogenase small subunit